MGPAGKRRKAKMFVPLIITEDTDIEVPQEATRMRFVLSGAQAWDGSPGETKVQEISVVAGEKLQIHIGRGGRNGDAVGQDGYVLVEFE